MRKYLEVLDSEAPAEALPKKVSLTDAQALEPTPRHTTNCSESGVPSTIQETEGVQMDLHLSDWTAPWKQTEDGRFIVRKHVPGIMGKAAANKANYVVVDTRASEARHQYYLADNLNWVAAWIYWRRLGGEARPLFGESAFDAPSEKLVDHPEYADWFQPGP